VNPDRSASSSRRSRYVSSPGPRRDERSAELEEGPDLALSRLRGLGTLARPREEERHEDRESEEREEGDDVLSPADRERAVRRDEGEVEQQEAHDRRRHRGPEPADPGGDHDDREEAERHREDLEVRVERHERERQDHGSEHRDRVPDPRRPGAAGARRTSRSRRSLTPAS
jgi:hypothetical protein